MNLKRMKLQNTGWRLLTMSATLSALFACTSCANPVNPSDQASLTAEQRKLDEKQISLAIRDCLHKGVVKVERSKDSAQDVAERLHQRCEVPFMALRQAKLGYLDLPDVETPPPQVKEEEVAICLEVVERFRVYRKEAIKERLRQLPPGWMHPPVPAPAPKTSEQTDVEKGFF